jgi:NAD(P)-dependent dehydrogenase (short-subunit alcohol dehydrogenase family)
MALLTVSGRTVVVTGAGSGIGRAIAVGFCSDGASVVGIGRREESLEETRSLCGQGRMHFIVGDVSRQQDVRQLFHDAFQRYGKVDFLINNAAIYPKQGFLESTHEEWSQVLHTNVLGMTLCCREALPGMLERGFGRIINLGSFAWKGPIPGSSAYSASKAAVSSFTKALAAEIDNERYPDVLVNELMPGIIKTAMSETGAEPSSVYPHVRFVATLPKSGPTGRAFVRSELHFEDYGMRARLRRYLARLMNKKQWV